MPFIKWDKSFEIGLKDIDDQHMELVGVMNTLFSALLSRKHADVLDQAFFTLDSYVKFHFQTEEDLFEVHGYPAATAHKEQHTDFQNRVQELRNHPENISPAADIQSLLTYLKNWFLTHTQGEDRKYIPFFQSKDLIVEVEAPPAVDTSIDRGTHKQKLFKSINVIPLVPWSSKFNIGDKRLDKQHQDLIELINVLYTTIKNPKRTDVVENALKELHAFTDYHFEYEEKILKDSEIPEIDSHRNMHREFRIKTAEIKSRYGKYKTVVDHDLVFSLRTWFTTHEIDQDMRLVAYLAKPR
jgi:hemerythrin